MRLKAIIAALLILVSSQAFAQSGSVKSQFQLNNEINSLFPDQTTGVITPYVARQTFLDMVASSAISTVSVTSYGAKGDCVTDDSPAFNLALANSNTRVIVPNPPGGCYAIATPIVIGNGTWVGLAATAVSTIQNVVLEGVASQSTGQNLSFGSLDSNGKAIQLKWTGTAGGTPITVNGPGSFGIKNISIDGNAGNAGTTLLLKGIYRSRIENVSVWNFNTTGVREQSSPTLPAGLYYGTCVNEFINVTGNSTGYAATGGLDIGGTDLTAGTYDVCQDNYFNNNFSVDNSGHTASALILRGADLLVFSGVYSLETRQANH